MLEMCSLTHGEPCFFGLTFPVLDPNLDIEEFSSILDFLMTNPENTCKNTNECSHIAYVKEY